MRFTLIYRGRIPSQGSVEQIKAIRREPYLQAQLAALYSVTSRTYATGNKQVIGDTLYTAILPVGWVCSAELTLIRATPQALINGLPDIDNTLKTLFDAICAPYGTGLPPATVVPNASYVIALEDKQISSITVSSDHHWSSHSNDDLAIVRVTTKRRQSTTRFHWAGRASPRYARMYSNSTATANHALQRTAPRVTLAAPAASLRSPPATFPQPPRRAPQSLSLGSFGVIPQ